MKAERCRICGRKLTNPDSCTRGIGPVCYKKYFSSINHHSKELHQKTLLDP
ncbi:MAG: hypothetical protein HXS47_02895 [Theionarchaea archaeon]|nr:hypothetical protein [Theionarchaea archaeon]